MRALRTILLSSLCACGLWSPLAAQAVWTVAPSGADFDSVQGAIDFASPGDTVLILSGRYTGFVLDKSLRVIGVKLANGVTDPGVGSVTIRDIDESEAVLVSNVTSGNRLDAVLTLDSCDGPLVFHSTVWTGAVVSGCSNVWFSESFVDTVFTEQTVALECYDSRILFQSTLLVGDAVVGEPIRATRSEIVARDGQIRAFPLETTSFVGTLMDHSTVLWSGGEYGDCFRPPCIARFSSDSTSSSRFLPGVQTELRVDQDDERVRLEVSLAPGGSLVVLAFSEVGPASSPDVDGFWLDSSTLGILDARITSPSGELVILNLPVVKLPVRLGVAYAIQAGILTTDGEVSFTNRGIVVF